MEVYKFEHAAARRTSRRAYARQHAWPSSGAADASSVAGQTRSLPAGARAEHDEQLVQLVERLVVPGDRPGCDRGVERLLRRIAVVDDQPGPRTVVLERHGGHDRAPVIFLV